MRRKKILVVEDDAIIAAHLSQVLTRLGHEVVGLASTGEEAMTGAAEHTPDLLIMDIRLKGSINGIEAGKQIFEKHGIPIVFVSAFADASFADRVEQIEPFAYLAKPFKEEDLYHAVKLAFFKQSIYAERFAWRNAGGEYAAARAGLEDVANKLLSAVDESLEALNGDSLQAQTDKLEGIKAKLKNLREVLDALEGPGAF